MKKPAQKEGKTYYNLMKDKLEKAGYSKDASETIMRRVVVDERSNFRGKWGFQVGEFPSIVEVSLWFVVERIATSMPEDSLTSNI